MTGPDKQVFIEQWKYGVLVTRKLQDDQRKTANSNSVNKSANNSSLNKSSMNPMRPENSGFLD